ncbi:isopeptide-forming domain-containing fimbrial protein [Collinsella sp. AF02-46-1]|uniref:isopeptide-forming domain-containing fimbrial protein n=1 Tax=Collinsella sp. AF02-46-1 TaxID=2292207 RepID=UPI000E4B6877|nr:isopeptide-forming domain-containing fimbrial protein [Collinsella sp. AF02-46-1]RGX52607.1 isopeptide-forming domain-containing fimbrial protein [Collinsella sp. AF02-46-1]
MKITKSIAHLAVTAGLTAVLSFGGVMAPVSMAFAAEGAATANGSVTITNVKGNTTEFEGNQIFKADVATVEGKTVASNITWANGSVKTAVEEVIREKEPNYKGKTAQDAADWITNEVTGTDETTRVDSNHIAYKIAAAVDNLTEKTTTTNGAASGLAHGYWLFVTKADTINEGEAGTSPIFTVVGSTPVNVSEKTGIPTVEKKIVSDADNTEHDAADSQIGQDVTYNLYGTVAENFDKYDTYFYQFSDQISKGLTLQSGAEVYLYDSVSDAKGDLTHKTGRKITNNFKQSAETVDSSTGAKTTKWTCENLKDVSGITKQSCVVVSYKARINTDAIVAGTEGNDNTVILNYSNDPMNKDGKGQTPPDKVKDYTYGLKINKVDLGTEAALDGAEFTIQATGADDGASTNLYVQQDGSLGKTPWKFKTANGGIIKVVGLDAGVYTVTETSAPDGYTTVEPFTFEIKPTMKADDPGAGLTLLGSTLDPKNQNDKIIAGLTDGNSGDNKLTAKSDSEKDSDGTFNITVGNTKQINLPLTGLNGVTFTWIAGGAVLCIGVAHLIRSRRRDDGSEE